MATKRKFTNEVIVGLVIIVAIVVSVYGYIFLREIPVRQKGFHVYMVFKDITGLERGDMVTVSGLKVGRVREMRLDNGYVRVKAWLNGDIPFPKDSRAAIRSIGMIGEKYIDLKPGVSEETLREGDVIKGEYINDIADMGGPVSELIAQPNVLLHKVNAAMDSAFSRETQKHFAETLEFARNISAQIQDGLRRNMNELQSSIRNFDAITTELRGYWQRNRVAIDSTTIHVASLASQMRYTLSNLDSVLTVTRRLLAEVENENGTVGKAIKSQELYEKLNSTLNEAQTILNDIKKHPGKYLQLSIIRLF
ncbi:MAG: MlaD family protein [candidate division KSB1 bacterium]|nr:MlaD family protein [candidate division KSB1 bacterium]